MISADTHKDDGWDIVERDRRHQEENCTSYICDTGLVYLSAEINYSS